MSVKVDYGKNTVQISVSLVYPKALVGIYTLDEIMADFNREIGTFAMRALAGGETENANTENS